MSYSGASFKFTVLDPTGARKATQVGQLPQSSYLSLGTPYSYFGLGRTNNYVENLFIGSTRQQVEHYINVEGLIPNSQVVIDPFQPAGRSDPSSWTRELFLHPGDWIPWVTVVLTAAIGLLGIVVFVLHMNEKVRSPPLCRIGDEEHVAENHEITAERRRAREAREVAVSEFPGALRGVELQHQLLYFLCFCLHRTFFSNWVAWAKKKVQST